MASPAAGMAGPPVEAQATMPAPPRPPGPGPVVAAPPASFPAAGSGGLVPPHAASEEAYEGRTIAGGMHIPGASSMYQILGLLQLAAGLIFIIMPYKMTDLFFRNMHLPHHREDIDVLYEELWRVLGACLFAGAIACYALKVGADRHLLDDHGVQRLQLGLLWWALLAVLLHLVHLLFTKSLTVWGLLIGAAVMAPTLALPSVHLGLSGGFAFQAESLSACMRNIFAPRRVTISVFLYALLTILFTLAGLAYVVLPKLTLKWVFGYHTGKPAVFLWQWIGAALLFLFPAITYTLQERALAGRLAQTVPKVLNVGLLVAALFHCLELGTLLVDGGVQGRWLLPVLFAHWLVVLLASIIGLSVSEHRPPVYEYEPLEGGRAGVV